MSSVKSPTQLFLFGALAVAIVVLAAMGKASPRVSYRTLTIAITLFGVMMCTAGSVGYFVARAPLHPLTILSSGLGLVALSIGVLTLLNLSIPLISTDRSAFYAVALIILVKFLVARIHTALIN